MDSDIQFVHEAPHLVQGHKKRPRLVTSCDSCRQKKVKCIQTTNNVKCEACESAQVPCLYRDRERYFAERSRIMSNSPSPSQSRAPSRASNPSKREDTPPHHLGWSPSASRGEHMLPSSVPQLGVHHPSHSGSGYRSASSSCAPGNQWQGPDSSSYSTQHQEAVYPNYAADFRQPQPLSQAENPLFDPIHSDRPNSTLLAHFIQIFFNNLETSFPFLSRDTITRQFYDRSLSSLVANCISALAARFSDKSEVIQRGVRNVQDQYCSVAESLLLPAIKQPNLEVLHASTLLAWLEYKRGHFAPFCKYTNMALRVATNLGLHDERTIRAFHNEHERSMLRSSWACVNQLSQTAQSFNQPQS